MLVRCVCRFVISAGCFTRRFVASANLIMMNAGWIAVVVMICLLVVADWFV